MIRLAVALLLGLVAAPPGVAAQPAGKVARVGYLSMGASNPLFIEAFRQGLREHGWVDGGNLVIEVRLAEGRQERLPDLVADLLRAKVDVLATGGTLASVAAKGATSTTPIVVIGVGDPVAVGLVASLPRPGGNVTGLSFTASLETYGKSLELLREALPKARRVAVLSNPAHPLGARLIEHLRIAARSLGLQLLLLEARGAEDIDRAFATMAKERAEALLVLSDATFGVHRTRLADLATRHKLPSMHGYREFVEVGGLMSYGPNLEAVFRRAGSFVDRILKGAGPADLPVEQPTTLELVINAKAARAIGIVIPPALRQRADAVLE